ncbi:Outer membrane protein ArfA [Mycobacterium basiliense]|uniref:Outer membrane protein ArfA n=1 Tax=Mycobacterium basiliense TaxID=2094119 RepID=A0A3S4CEG2_9MYCO|nr:OmpA family protein [Mycobacterium basiliense]VDM90442.1 Outer membrane protein ArfA [Mycobacterium basiliense]
MGTEAGIDASPAPTDAPAASKFDRRPLGVPWLIGLAVIPLLLAAIGSGVFQRPAGVTGPTGDLPTLSTTTATSSAPGLSLSLLSVSRSGNTITLIGDFPDEGAKATLMKSLNGLLKPDVTVIDQIRIDPLVRALDFANAEPVFTASALIPDFTLKVEGDTVTLSGTAASPDQKDAVERAAVGAWSGVKVTNHIAVQGQAPPAAATAPCGDLQATINGLTGGSIGFADDGVSLTPADNQILTKVADKLKACPDARVTLNGYADNSGGEGINIPLSAQRATTVAKFLIAQGVAGDHIATKGLGSTNPIASNDTPDGRIKNRRVEIVVS